MTSNYFRYLPVSAEMTCWGVAVAGAGFASIPARSSYPPKQHPTDHYFTWDRGRTLDSLQILLVTAGCGMLETRATGLRRVEAGMAFLLLPNCWHRYRPDPVSGWDENWIEITGPVVDQILAGGVFSAETVLRSGAIDAGMDEVFDAIHRHMCNDGDQFHPDLSAAALQLLACCARIGLSRPERSRSRRLVQQAEHYLTAHHTEPVNIEGLARKFGVAYSHFRRLFRAQTGFPPWQYVLRLRLDRARRLMAASDAKLEEIARRVGFASAFHLSLAFKRTYGESPSHWRRSLAKEIGAPLCPPGAGLTASRP